MHISRRIAAVAVMAAAAGTLASCSGPGPASPPGAADQGAAGPAVTLARVQSGADPPATNRTHPCSAACHPQAR
jgi:hypothetical protein